MDACEPLRGKAPWEADYRARGLTCSACSGVGGWIRRACEVRAWESHLRVYRSRLADLELGFCSWKYQALSEFKFVRQRNKPFRIFKL